MSRQHRTSPACAATRSWSMLAILLLAYCVNLAQCMNLAQVRSLRQDTRNLFYHGFTNYMNHAFPEDELKPISCEPQTRNRENPADIGLNDVLGNYSLTLIDSLSTLAILASGEGNKDKHNSLQDFKGGVEALVELYGAGDETKPCGSRACGFDLDSKVQVFETNIRGVGGLLSAHLFAVGDLPIHGYKPSWRAGRNGTQYIEWHGFRYDGQLLRLAHDLATRLLPAFGTTTGLPYPRVNLRHGAAFYHESDDGVCHPDGSSTGSKEITETCAAGAGSLMLEFSTLSRLTGDPTFETLAGSAFTAVWDRRSPIGLVGNGIDAETGQWTVPALSGIGAGIDSFFEYALKSSILLSGAPANPDSAAASHTPELFLDVWQKAHAAVKHHIYRPSFTEKHPYYGQTDTYSGAPRYAWVDNLSAYYPGLLTLAGELDEAIESHLLFAALWTRYAALPERWLVPNAFIDPNFRHWAGRPEFIESTFYLYQATKDPFYLHTGEMALRDIRRRCWTPCGWADLGDVVTGEKRDRMESFFLGETAKYLYLLFEEDHPLNKMDAPVVFTTEGHPLTIPLRSRKHERRPTKTSASLVEAEIPPTCPAPPKSLPLTSSNLVNRTDFFHAALLAQLHLVPKQPARESALSEPSEDGPGLTLADLSSPTNYTYFPWTLPQDLVPLRGFSEAIKIPTTSTLTFPNLDVSEGVEKPPRTPTGIHKFMDGILLSSLSNIRLNMVQEPKIMVLPSSDGRFAEVDVGPQYRIQGVANWALGRDEKVVITKEAMDGVAPGDPNFRRMKDLEMVDIILDYVVPTEPSTNTTTAMPAMEDEVAPSGIMSTMEAFIVNLITPDEDAGPKTTSIAPLRTIVPAILPTGVGAAPLPAAIDTSDPGVTTPGQLSLQSIYFMDDTLCDAKKLPARIPKNHQILVVKRGGCSFNAKLESIPSFAPSTEALQAVIVLSVPKARSPEEELHGTSEKMIRPLLDEKQLTPGGIERRHGIAMAMIDSPEDVLEAFRNAATTIGWYDEAGVLQEEIRPRTASGLGIKRRYWFESMGIPIGNIIAL